MGRERAKIGLIIFLVSLVLIGGCQQNLLGQAYVANDAKFVSMNASGFAAKQGFVCVGQYFPMSVSMINMGGSVWSGEAGYKLGSENPADNKVWGFGRVSMGGEVLPGSAYEFNFNSIAPKSQGVYSMQWRMLKERVEWFGEKTVVRNISVVSGCVTGMGCCVRDGFVIGPNAVPNGIMYPVACWGAEDSYRTCVNGNWSTVYTNESRDDASFVTLDVGGFAARQNFVCVGEHFPVSVNMRNTGVTNWSYAAGYKLGSENPADNKVWGFGRVSVGRDIMPGASASFKFDAVAPNASGVYNMQWRMLKERVHWFGEKTVNLNISVVSGCVTGMGCCVPDGFIIGANETPDGTNYPSACWAAQNYSRLCSEGAWSNLSFRNAQILDVPIPEDSFCFWQEERDNPLCSRYYVAPCEGCGREPACSGWYNPVYDSNGEFYPSACWAEHFGVTNYNYGYSDRLRQFTRDIWRTPKNVNTPGFSVLYPDFEFMYRGYPGQGADGTFASSTLWINSTKWISLYYLINTPNRLAGTVNFNDGVSFTQIPYGQPKNFLLVFIDFETGYSDDTLLSWTPTYVEKINDYFRKKQRVNEPLQLNVTVRIIAPPPSVTRISGDHPMFTAQEKHDIAYAAYGTEYEGNLIVVPIQAYNSTGFDGGYQDMYLGQYYFIVSGLRVTDTDSVSLRAGLNSLINFQETFNTISHELLHAAGWPGDHPAVEYKMYSSITPFSNLDPINLTTGKAENISACQYLGYMDNYYAVPLPANLVLSTNTTLGYPSEDSPSGRCLYLPLGVLKDANRDGMYESLYANEYLSIPLQNTLGWTDIDGDSIAEIADTTPYGGIYQAEEAYIPCEGTCADPVTCSCPEHFKGPSVVHELGRVTINGCTFERISLDDGTTGLLPLQCAEFDKSSVNVYRNLKYTWYVIQKEYGTVLLPRLGILGGGGEGLI